MDRLRKRKTVNPCAGCGLHAERCICATIPRLDLRTRISLVIHAKELKRTTNTGRLALKALVNSQMYIRGEDRAGTDLSPLLTPEYETYVLYPEEEAIELDQLRPEKPIQLIVSDGNWRQAGKLNTRQPELRHLPRVKIASANTALYHLRKEHFSEGLSTLEAIALALQSIEGPHVGEQLLSLYHAKLAATLEGRGIQLGRT